jgi:glycosyltransferase involved in cell wall biosynthesis
MAGLRIGIDAHSIGSRQSGNETYYRSLLQALGRADTKHDYVVYGTNLSALLDLQLDRQRFRISPVRPAARLARISLVMPLKTHRDQLDVFHAQHIIPPFVKCRTVTTIPDLAHEHYPEYFSPWQVAWSKRLILWSARKADHIITVSHYSKADLVNRYAIDPEKISVTYEAAGREYYPRDRGQAREQIARRHGIERPFILYVGRLQGRKNLVRLVEAYAQVRLGGAEHQLVMVGRKEWMAEPILARIADLGLEDDVVLTGYVASEDLPWFYNAADVFAYPSFFEGFGLPVIEAMACGTPVVTSMGSSLQEVAGDAALIVDPSDVNSIRLALERVLGDKALRMKLRRAGIRRSSQFDPDRTAMETVSVYERVAGLETTLSSRIRSATA